MDDKPEEGAGMKAVIALLVLSMAAVPAVSAGGDFYEDGYFDISFNGKSIEIIPGYGSVVHSEVQEFRAKHLGEWVHVHVDDGLVKMDVIECPLLRFCY